MTAKIFTFANNKGGVTKTTTSIQIAYGLARRGRRVLVIDTDAQSNATYSLLGSIEDNSEFIDPDKELNWLDDTWLAGTSEQFAILEVDDGEEEKEEAQKEPFVLEKTLYEVLVGINGDARQRIPLEEIIIPIPQQTGLFLAPSSIALSSADMDLASSKGREYRLKRAIEPLLEKYDYIIIDTPPNLGILTVNAIVAAATGIVIPLTPQTYSVVGINAIKNAIMDIQEEMNIVVPLFGVICSRVTRTRNSRDRIEEVTNYFGRYVFSTFIPVNEKVEEAAGRRQSIFEYAPTSSGAKAFSTLVQLFEDRATLADQKRGK